MTLPLVAQAGGDGPFVRWDWIWGHLDLVWEKVVEHLVLTGIALGVGLAVSLLLSAVVLRWRPAYAPITWVTGVAYSIPSLALFAFLVPITGFTILTAEIGLVSYTLLILIRNMVAGIDGVDPAVKEAALGMGYTRRRMFFQIELPLALPVIIAGLRIAGVTTIGLVTVTALIGQGGVGYFILRGLNRFFSTEIVLGTVLSVILAVALDLALLGVERLLTPWSKRQGAST
ncbi:MAG: ABC transporter permease [Acidimicrobiia bacterium]|nr:ABC transporter permease [Acidimicrobiia bacterium]NNF87938.1 ABC transporter permease [Acidimicrobiia bacterium]NNJ48159.1 ABC transporter permease [Acidimicrobiia bacterium]NNL12136.1 ABC transporter permease [Acidimicrobiia bacterium]